MFGLGIWRVRGHSMAPKLEDGSFVLLQSRVKLMKLNAGDQIVINHPQFGHMIKSVVRLDLQGSVWCRGENDHSISMSQIGGIPLDRIVGKVIIAITPAVK